MNRIATFVILILAILPLSCKDCGTNGDGEGNSINPNIVRIKYCCSDFNGGNFRMGVWLQQNVFCIYPGRLLTFAAEFRVEKDSLVVWPGGLFVSANPNATKLLLTKSIYSDVSVGSLLEIDAHTFQNRVVRDSTYNVSSALYDPNGNACIYYSYGNQVRQMQAGYYRLNLSNLRDSLLFRYVPEIGPAEVVNGFDISPDGTKILFPTNRAADSPLVVEYTLATGERETLNVSFDRQLLWLRYHPSGRQILYSNYPRGAGGSSVAIDSEIGIIDRMNLSKRVLDVNTNAGGLSVSVFPNWSPDGKHILYGSAPGPVQEPPGAKGAYSLYILRNVN